MFAGPWLVLACAGPVLLAAACAETRQPSRPDDNQGGAAQGGAGEHVGAGGAPEPIQACQEAAEAFCASVYACLSAEELAALELPALVAGCVMELGVQQGCAVGEPVALCEGFAPDAAARCVSEAASASCEDIQSGREFAPHCNLVCAES